MIGKIDIFSSFQISFKSSFNYIIRHRFSGKIQFLARKVSIPAPFHRQKSCRVGKIGRRMRKRAIFPSAFAHARLVGRAVGKNGWNTETKWHSETVFVCPTTCEFGEISCPQNFIAIVSPHFGSSENQMPAELQLFLSVPCDTICQLLDYSGA